MRLSDPDVVHLLTKEIIKLTLVKCSKEYGIAKKEIRIFRDTALVVDNQDDSQRL